MDSARFNSGNAAISSATISSTEPTESRFRSRAAFKLLRYPVTITSSTCTAAGFALGPSGSSAARAAPECAARIAATAAATGTAYRGVAAANVEFRPVFMTLSPNENVLDRKKLVAVTTEDR